MEYKVHNVEWNDKKVGQLWDFYNNYPAFEDLWFSKAVGRGIIKFASKFKTISGDVLDYGMGKGHFATYLLENKMVNVYGCDFSEETVLNNEQRFKNESYFKGCVLIKEFPSSFKENQFDYVFLIEAIEHLTDNYLHPTLIEIHRVLKPGGVVIITTPNNEDLNKQNVICPDCGCVFHRVQHVRSFTAASLKRLVNKHGFIDLFCDATDFFQFTNKGNVYKVRNIFKKRFFANYQYPHLAYIGRKTKNEELAQSQ